MTSAIAAAATVVITLAALPVQAEDPRCGVLRALAAQYAGVTLTAHQQSFRARAHAWYRRNCRAQH